MLLGRILLGTFATETYIGRCSTLARVNIGLGYTPINAQIVHFGTMVCHSDRTVLY